MTDGDGVAARRIIETQAMPRDLRLVQVDARTPGSVLESLADMALDCGVLPMCSDVLRGLLQPSVCFVALDGRGRASDRTCWCRARSSDIREVIT